MIDLCELTLSGHNRVVFKRTMAGAFYLELLRNYFTVVDVDAEEKQRAKRQQDEQQQQRQQEQEEPQQQQRHDYTYSSSPHGSTSYRGK